MAYDGPIKTVTYHWLDQDVAAAQTDNIFAGPSGLKGKVKLLMVTCSETFSGTSGGVLTLGTASGGAQIFSFQIDVSGTPMAANDCWVVSFNDNGTATEVIDVGASGNAATTVTTNDLAADTAYYLTCTTVAGGSDTGIADFMLVVDWANW